MTCVVVSSGVQVVTPPVAVPLQPSRHKHGQDQQQNGESSDAVECELLKSGGGLLQHSPRQLSPNLLPSSPVPLPDGQPVAASLVGNKYLILEPVEGSTLHKCVNIHTQQEYVCKVVESDGGALLAAHCRVDAHQHVNSLHEVLCGAQRRLYLVFPASYGDLHSHVRLYRRLREPEARRLFRQVASAVRACHRRGVVLRDLKLRKFVFADPSRTLLKLETLEDAVILDDSDDDSLQDKRGCPAYVSPEILRSHTQYSGRAADMWSLGVILYTMLVGRYPFTDSEHASLFAKISRGHFVMPESLSSRAKCLIGNLLRREPGERLSADDVLHHPWLTREERAESACRTDQLVPDIDNV